MKKYNMEIYPSIGGKTMRQMLGNEMNSVRGIIPPHMFDEIAKKGDTAQKELALKHMMLSEKIRGRREAFGEFFVSQPAGVKCLKLYDAKNGQELPGEALEDPGSSNDPLVNSAIWPVLQLSKINIHKTEVLKNETKSRKRTKRQTFFQDT